MLRQFLKNRHLFSKVKFSFINKDGTKTAVEAEKGEHLLSVAKKYDIEL